MHGVGLALVAEEAGGGGEAGVLAAFDLAAVGLEVGVDELARGGLIWEQREASAGSLLVVALELLGLVVAGGLALPGAVVEAVRLGIRILVEKVVPGRLTFAAHAARAKGRRQGKAILRHGGHHVSVQILRGHILRAIGLAGHPAGA